MAKHQVWWKDGSGISTSDVHHTDCNCPIPGDHYKDVQRISKNGEIVTIYIRK